MKAMAMIITVNSFMIRGYVHNVASIMKLTMMFMNTALVADRELKMFTRRWKKMPKNRRIKMDAVKYLEEKKRMIESLSGS